MNTPTRQNRDSRADSIRRRFADSRSRLANDPHRPAYHFVSPESNMNDPNGLCFWQGRWHLFYQAYPPDSPGVHWGHAVSTDLIHWQDLPYAIAPGPEEHCFSGATWVEEDRVIAMYHGVAAGNMIAVSQDPLLQDWSKLTSAPVIPIATTGDKEDARWRAPDGTRRSYRVFDPCIWKKGDTYYSLSAGSLPDRHHGARRFRADFLFRSRDLVHWEYLHPFVEGDRFTQPGDDGACPYFLPIGDRHILLFFSHMTGGQYLLGDYDTARDIFIAARHGKFNFGAARPAGVHAPSAAPDSDGGVIVIFNMNAGKSTQDWNQLMTLPRRLTLDGAHDLRMEPAGDSASLRDRHTHLDAMPLPANREIVLDGIAGNTLELEMEIDAKGIPMLELNVLRSPDRQEFTRITFFPDRGTAHSEERDPPARRYSLISLDTSRSSTLPDVAPRGPETAEVLLANDEPLRLHVFIDRSVVEVFVNDRQCVAARLYPGRSDSLGVSLRAQGRPAHLRSLDAWSMNNLSIQPGATR